MNSETQILEPPPVPATIIESPSSHPNTGRTEPRVSESSFEQSKIKNQKSEIDPPIHPAVRKGNRGNGKVARLPKAIRDQLNYMILDGVSYPEIIRRLGDDAKHLNPDHIHEWKKFGYQDWLLERDWLDRLGSKAEFSDDILAAPSSANLHEAGLRLAASQMFDQLMRFNAASETGASDQSEKFARLVNALSRLTREALAFQKYRDILAQSTAAELKELDQDRDLAANELSLLVNKMDKTFKVARPNLDRLLAQQAKRMEAQQTGARPHSSVSALAAPERLVAPGQLVAPEQSGGGSAPTNGNAHVSDIPSPRGEGQGEGERNSVASIQQPAAREHREGEPATPARSEGDSRFKVQGSKFDACRAEVGRRRVQGSRSEIPLTGSPTFSPADPLTHSPTDASASQPSTPQPSTEPAELCYACGAPLPPVKPDGTRPSPSCPGCNIRLHPAGTTYDQCPSCNAYQPISASGQRYSKECDHCHQVLPPVGHRYTAECPSCGLGLNNFTRDGDRVIERCPDCRTLLPLYEPIPTAAPERIVTQERSDGASAGGLAAPKSDEGGSNTSSSTLSDTLSNTTSPPDSTVPPALAA